MKTLKVAVFILVGVMVMVTPLLGACGAAEEAAAPAAPTAEEPLELTFGGVYMPGVAWGEGQNRWMDKIEADTNGRVQFERTWGGTLVQESECNYQVAEGVCDIGHINLAYARYGNELYQGTLAFWSPIQNMRVSYAIYDDLRAKFPEIDAETSMVKALTVGCCPPGQLMTIKPVRTTDDLRGMQIAGSVSHTIFCDKFGATLLMIEVFDMITGLQKATVDATIMPFDAFVPVGFYEFIPYVTFIDWGYPPFVTTGMNWDVWNSLPADIKQVFEDNEAYYKDQQMDVFITDLEKAYDAAEEYGVELFEISGQDRLKLLEVYDAMSAEKVAELDAMGKPGTAIYEELFRLMEEYGVR
jgi:TRAP-type C4-dicarboxylate transport system substrate-binding protein